MSPTMVYDQASHTKTSQPSVEMLPLSTTCEHTRELTWLIIKKKRRKISKSDTLKIEITGPKQDIQNRLRSPMPRGGEH